MCGFCEYVGLIQYVRDHDVHFGRVYGVSAGAGAAALLVLGVGAEAVTTLWERLSSSTPVGSTLTVNHLLGCRFLLQYPDAYVRATNRLFIGVTTCKGFVWQSVFTSNTDLCNALVCSGTIPLVCSYQGTVGGRSAIDGGFSFTGAHVPDGVDVFQPSVPFPLSLLPPTTTTRSILYALGYYRARTLLRGCTPVPGVATDDTLYRHSIRVAALLIQRYQRCQYSVGHIGTLHRLGDTGG